MIVAFRVDASTALGIGHVMRCLVLADTLKSLGAQCHFISLELIGDLQNVIHGHGHAISMLRSDIFSISQTSPECGSSLCLDWTIDAQQTSEILANSKPDWLVVDHYEIDHQWERILAHHVGKLMVIDDLADRLHSCDLLLDQNFGRVPAHYADLVNEQCQVLTNSRYALLRPEFSAFRAASLQRRHPKRSLKQLLVSMGGVDHTNVTRKVLDSLMQSVLPNDCRIIVVMGLMAPWLEDVRKVSMQMPWETEVIVNAETMAQLMSESDLAIGAAGGTSWERCCLGLPTLLVVLAENQVFGARAMDAAGVAKLIGSVSDIDKNLSVALRELVNDDCRYRCSVAASKVTDGNGIYKVISALGL